MCLTDIIANNRGLISLTLFFLIYSIVHVICLNKKVNRNLNRLYNKINVNALVISIIVVTLFNLITKRIEASALSYTEITLGIVIIALIFNILSQSKKIK